MLLFFQFLFIVTESNRFTMALLMSFLFSSSILVSFVIYFFFFIVFFSIHFAGVCGTVLKLCLLSLVSTLFGCPLLRDDDDVVVATDAQAMMTVVLWVGWLFVWIAGWYAA